MSEYEGLSRDSLKERKRYFQSRLHDLVIRGKQHEYRLAAINARVKIKTIRKSESRKLLEEKNEILVVLPEVIKAIEETKEDIREINFLIDKIDREVPEGDLVNRVVRIIGDLREVNKTEKNQAVREFSVGVTKKLIEAIRK